MPKIQIKRELVDPVSDAIRAYFSRMELTHEPASAERGLTDENTNPILTAALEIPGVVQAVVKTYSLALFRAPSFEWAEIEPSVLRLMTAFSLPLEEELVTATDAQEEYRQMYGRRD